MGTRPPGTSSVCRRSGIPGELADVGEVELRIGEVGEYPIVCDLLGRDAECPGPGDTDRIRISPSLSIPEATLPTKLGALERDRRSVSSNVCLYSTSVFCKTGFLNSSPGTEGHLVACPSLKSESSNSPRSAVPSFSLHLANLEAIFKRPPASLRGVLPSFVGEGPGERPRSLEKLAGLSLAS